LSRRPGKLVIIGGAEDKQDSCEILREVVRLSGGNHARVVVLTVATELPIEVGSEYIEVFDRIGVADVRMYDVATREAANARSAIKAIEDATCVFFTGGDQVRVTKLLGGTKMDAALHERHESGLVLAGTSAGASMMSSTMIISGISETNPKVGIVDMGPGMEFISGVVIDQHFAQRGRYGRLFSAVAQYPHHLGLGIDENTAIVVDGHEFSVIGAGAVSVIDGGQMTYSNINQVREGDDLALCGFTMHILPKGQRFNLRDRAPILEADTPDKSE